MWQSCVCVFFPQFASFVFFCSFKQTDVRSKVSFGYLYFPSLPYSLSFKLSMFFFLVFGRFLHYSFDGNEAYMIRTSIRTHWHTKHIEWQRLMIIKWRMISVRRGWERTRTTLTVDKMAISLRLCSVRGMRDDHRSIRGSVAGGWWLFFCFVSFLVRMRA